MKTVFWVTLFALGILPEASLLAQCFRPKGNFVSAPIPVYVQPVYVYPQASWKWKVLPSTQYSDQGFGPVSTTVYVGQWVYSY